MWSRTSLFSLTSSYIFLCVFNPQITCLFCFFFTSLIAREALRSKHPLMKLRPLSKSSNATKAKARSCSGTNTVPSSISPVPNQFVFCVSHINTLTHPLYLSSITQTTSYLPKRDLRRALRWLASLWLALSVLRATWRRSSARQKGENSRRQKVRYAKRGSFPACAWCVLQRCTKSWQFVLTIRNVFECIL